MKETDHDSGVDSILFLQHRHHATDTATLLSTGSGGVIRAWCMFGGGLAGEFMASNNHRESVLCMTSDEKNEFLITGDSQGYIKIWNIKNYCIAEQNKSDKGFVDVTEHLSKARRQVPLPESLRKRKINRIAPPLVFYLRAHLQPIVSIDYVPKYNLLITASTDCSLRLWKNNGLYIGTFGQRNIWNLSNAGEGDIPSDLRRAASVNSMSLMRKTSRKRWSVAKSFIKAAGRLSLGLNKLTVNKNPIHESSTAKSIVLNESECRIDMDNILGL